MASFVPGWANDTFVLAAGIIAVGGVLVGLWKIFRMADQVADAWVVLAEIAQEFKPDHGESLHDRVNAATEAAHQANNASIHTALAVDDMKLDITDLRDRVSIIEQHILGGAA